MPTPIVPDEIDPATGHALGARKPPSCCTLMTHPCSAIAAYETGDPLAICEGNAAQAMLCGAAMVCCCFPWGAELYALCCWKPLPQRLRRDPAQRQFDQCLGACCFGSAAINFWENGNLSNPCCCFALMKGGDVATAAWLDCCGLGWAYALCCWTPNPVHFKRTSIMHSREGVNGVKGLQPNPSILQQVQPKPSMMAVAVPIGVNAGDLITVQDPSGNPLQATVPPGVQAGQIFMLQIPASQAAVVQVKPSAEVISQPVTEQMKDKKEAEKASEEVQKKQNALQKAESEEKEAQVNLAMVKDKAKVAANQAKEKALEAKDIAVKKGKEAYEAAQKKAKELSQMAQEKPSAAVMSQPVTQQMMAGGTLDCEAAVAQKNQVKPSTVSN